MKSGMKIADTMLDLIGDIPLVRLNHLGHETGAEILVKPEFLNPSGSIKDRIAVRMVEDAERQGVLKKGVKIIEATGGNTGTALAFVSAVKGYDFIAYVPDEIADPSRLAIMLAYGAEAVTMDIDAYEETRSDLDSSKETRGAHGGYLELSGRQFCLDLTREQDDVWWARQFANANNVDAHREGTAQEILEKTDGELDAFVASVGTGGTLFGVSQVLKEHNPGIVIWGVEPAGTPMVGEPGAYPIIPGVSDGIIKDIQESGLVDNVLPVTDEQAIDMAHQLVEKEGIFCGMSSGANVFAALRLAKEFGPGKRIVTVLPDSRDRYLQYERYTT
jgi:cysteine synthase A